MPSAGVAFSSTSDGQFQGTLAGHLHDGHHQALLVGEAAVEGPDADAGPLRDPFHRRLVPALGEDILGGHQYPLQVELGVAAQGPGHGLQTSPGRRHSTPAAVPSTAAGPPDVALANSAPLGSCTGCRGIRRAVPAATRSASAETTKAKM